MYIWGWGRDHSIACLEMDARDANAIQEEKGRAYLQRLTHRKNRYEHYLRHGTTEKYKKPMSYKMEKLARMGKYKDFEDLEHGRYSEKMKYLMMHKGYHHHKGDYYAMMMEEMYREGENGEDVSSDEEEISQQTEEKFKELEEERNKWHVDMDRTRYSTVYHTKDIVSNYILLGNDYSTERIIAMTDFLKEPVFLTKMCHLAVRWRQPSTLKVLIKYGRYTCGCMYPALICGHIHMWLYVPCAHMWSHTHVVVCTQRSYVVTYTCGCMYPVLICGHIHMWLYVPSAHMWSHTHVVVCTQRSYVVTYTCGCMYPVLICGHIHMWLYVPCAHMWSHTHVVVCTQCSYVVTYTCGCTYPVLLALKWLGAWAFITPPPQLYVSPPPQ